MGLRHFLYKHRTLIPVKLWQIPLLFKKKYIRRNLKLEVNIVDHCNLKCSGCDVFSSLADERHLSLDSYRRDLERLSVVFRNRMERITLLGGEPLLSSRITDFIDIAREIFADQEMQPVIEIITNGILLKSMPDEFYENCKRNDVLISVTKYPIKLDYDGIVSELKSRGVRIEFAFGTDETLKTMHRTPLDVNGKQNPKLSFKLCLKANSCITLKDGKLFTCSVIPNLEIFNRRFHQNGEVTEADYVDIYKNDDPDQILEKLATYVPACRYCDNLHYRNGIPWKVTAGKMEEWTK